MVHSNTKNAKSRVSQSQVCYLCTTHSSTPNCLFIQYFQHRDTPDNNPDTPFEFTSENLKVSSTSHLFIYYGSRKHHTNTCE